MEGAVTARRSGRETRILGTVLMFTCVCLFIVVAWHQLSIRKMFSTREEPLLNRSINSRQVMPRPATHGTTAAAPEPETTEGYTFEIAGWEEGVPRDAETYIKPSNDTAIIKGEQICDNDTRLVIIVTTAPANSSRSLIRKTWGSMRPGHIKIGFIVGLTWDQSNQTLLEQENEQYQDIIQEDVVDSFNNLTLKSIFILKWFINNCQNSTILMKCDDDTFVNIELLDRQLAPYRPNGMLMGKLCTRCWVFRNYQSKWYVPKYMYSWPTYPDFLFGWAYFMSMDVAVKLYAAAMKTPIINLEDVYLTGLCAKVARVTPKRFPGYSDFVIILARDCPTNFTMCHPIKPAAMRYLWSSRKEVSNMQLPSVAVDTPQLQVATMNKSKIEQVMNINSGRHSEAT